MAHLENAIIRSIITYKDIVSTANPLYTDTRYNYKIRDSGDLTGTQEVHS